MNVVTARGVEESYVLSKVRWMKEHANEQRLPRGLSIGSLQAPGYL